MSNLTDARLSYDASGRPSQITQGSRTYTLAYDSLGRVSSMTDPLTRVVSYTYDAAGRVLTKTLPDLRVIQFSYDSNGNVTSVTPPGRSAHNFAFTSRDDTQSYNAKRTDMYIKYFMDIRNVEAEARRKNICSLLYPCCHLLTGSNPFRGVDPPQNRRPGRSGHPFSSSDQ